MGQSARSAVAEYIQLLSGGRDRAKKVTLYPGKYHPSVQRALDIVRKQFRKMCLEEQDILGTPEKYEKVLELIPLPNVREDVRARAMKAAATSTERWDRMEAILAKRHSKVIDEIMLQYAYPRLDINVSKGLNHLLKSPFCIHPKTGRVCVPLDPKKIDAFDPETVPTVSQLTEEIDKFAKEESDKVVSKDYKKTSLREPMRIFEEFVSRLAETWKANHKAAVAAAPSMDF